MSGANESPQLTVRPARREDYAGLCALWDQLDRLHAELRPDYFRAPAGPTRSARAVALALGLHDRTILVAEQAGELLGLVTAALARPDPGPLTTRRVRGHVPELVVAPGHRRRGVGRALMRAAEAWALERGAVELVLTVWEGNLAAEAFYARLGYAPLTRGLKRELGAG